MKQYYIYLTTNKVNNKKYIGQHYGELNDIYYGSGTLISKAVKKYGKNNFKKEILHICTSREEADRMEKMYIQKYDAVNNNEFYNLQEGGTGGDGWRCAYKYLQEHPELYQKNGERLQQWRKDNPKLYYEKTIKPMLEGSKNWRKNNPDQVQEQMKKVNRAKEKWQQEHPDEHQAQVSAWRLKGSQTNSRKVLCITTNKSFDSISEAGRYYNIPQANISKCLKGERKSAGKHPKTKEKMFWKFL